MLSADCDDVNLNRGCSDGAGFKCEFCGHDPGTGRNVSHFGAIVTSQLAFKIHLPNREGRRKSIENGDYAKWLLSK